MKRVIDFDVSVGGLPAQIVRVVYESRFEREELLSKPYTEGGQYVVPEAVSALKKQLGHEDIEVVYWYWIE